MTQSIGGQAFIVVCGSLVIVIVIADVDMVIAWIMTLVNLSI